LYPHLKKESPANTMLASTELLDLATVMNVSQAVSGEVVLEKRFDSLMRAAIEHAGAARGLLIVPQGDQLLIEAEATIGGDAVIVRQRAISVSETVLLESVVRYVMRTGQDVLVNDATAANPFSTDFYILQHRVRSLLCLPLMNQAELTGVLYLENSLAARVFTPDRITGLKVLASQAAISLENTRLYRDLEVREQRIRRLIDSNIMGIVIWDLDGRLLEANDAFLRMVGYHRGARPTAGAQSLQLKEVPVIVLDHLTPAQRKAYLIADNKLAEFAGWDEDLLRLELKDLELEEFDLGVIGFSDEELRALLAEPDEVSPGLTDDDAVPEAPERPVTVRGDLWLLGNHRVLCGDATDVRQLIEGERADLVFTDPPYNVDYEGYTRDKLTIKGGRMKPEEFDRFLRATFAS
jgi:PAS domain-containing protein